MPIQETVAPTGLVKRKGLSLNAVPTECPSIPPKDASMTLIAMIYVHRSSLSPPGTVSITKPGLFVIFGTS